MQALRDWEPARLIVVIAQQVNQPFGFNAILGLIGLSGILIRNTLILVDQIHHDQATGLSDYEAIVESTVRRASMEATRSAQFAENFLLAGMVALKVHAIVTPEN